MNGIQFRAAGAADQLAILALLRGAELPVEDIRAAGGRQDFIVAMAGDRLAGCVAIEVSGDACLLRSFAVDPERRGGGLGSALYERILARASLRGVAQVYALTTTAERFFAKRGFERIDRAAAPAAVAASEEFRGLCPASAVCLRLRLSRVTE
jgi:amino-acid N-acetyltransferase